MAGQLGNKVTTIQKLKVIQINENILVIKGSVPESLKFIEYCSFRVN
jgi:ribosomal protein L3